MACTREVNPKLRILQHVLQTRVQQTFSIKDQLLKILDIVSHMVSDTAYQLCCYILKADLDKEWMCLCSNKIKLYLQKKKKK